MGRGGITIYLEILPEFPSLLHFLRMFTRNPSKTSRRRIVAYLIDWFQTSEKERWRNVLSEPGGRIRQILLVTPLAIMSPFDGRGGAGSVECPLQRS